MIQANSQNPRLAAVQSLAAVMQGRSLADASPEGLSGPERAYWQSLTYGCLRYLPRLQLILKRLLNKALKNKDADIQALLLLGLYQLDQQQAAEHAAVNETVALCKALNKSQFTGLCNALLRQFIRERQQIDQKLRGNPSYRFAAPTWLIKQQQQDWPQHYRELLDAHNQPGPMSLRVNQRHHSRAQYLELLSQAGIEARASELASHSIVLTQPMAVQQLPGWEQGWVAVQDEAASLAGELLTLSSGMRVLDACAAPGGKTCHLLERADLQLLALDSNPERLPRVAENLSRLGLTAGLKAADASDPASWWDGQAFDAILLDAPCSGLGVIRRHPDIKTLRLASDLEQLAELQQRLLQALWPCLKSGGQLLYCTCSTSKQENHDNVVRFLASQPDAKLLPLTLGNGSEYGNQLLPQPGSHDGFFYALLEKC